MTLVVAVDKREKNNIKGLKKHGKRGVFELGYGLPQQHPQAAAQVYGPPEPAPVYENPAPVFQPAPAPVEPARQPFPAHFQPAPVPQPIGKLCDNFWGNSLRTLSETCLLFNLSVNPGLPVGFPFPNPVGPAAVVAHPVPAVGVPIVQTITKHVGVPFPVPVHIDRPVAVPVAVPVPKPYPVHVERIVHVEKPVHYPVHVDRPVAVPVAVPVPKPYPVDRYVHVAVPYHVPKPYPVPVAVHATSHWKPAAQHGW